MCTYKKERKRYEQLLITNLCRFYFVNANVVHVHLYVVVTGMMDGDRGKAGSGTFLIFDRRDFVARHETMGVHVFLLVLLILLILTWVINSLILNFIKQTKQWP